MVADDDGALAGRQSVAGHEDVGAVDAGEDVLDVRPDGAGDTRAEVVGGGGEEEGQGQEEGEEGVCYCEVEEPEGEVGEGAEQVLAFRARGRGDGR